MITPEEEVFIKNNAYVPEHIPGYGMAISEGEPFLLQDYLCYQGKGFLIFVGYPLQGSFREDLMQEIFQAAVRRFKPVQIALIAPTISSKGGSPRHADAYYKLALADFRIPPQVKNMTQRAARELKVEMGQEFQEEHRNLIADFLASHPVDEGTRYILPRIPRYLSSVPTACIFNARDSAGKLVAFDIADFGAKHYAFYMFNCRSRQHHVPGASDLLLQALIREAEQQGKTYVNLGLGVNQGVAFFKKKWGGQPFLNHEFLLYRPSSPTLFDSLLQGLFRS
jgi:hypothetical protein